MEDEGVITGYWTCIDSYRLGYDVYRYYLVFQNITPDIKNEMIEQFVNYKNMWVVVSIKTVYDLGLVIWVKDVSGFYRFWDDINEKYGDYFAEKIFSVYLIAHVFPSSFLIYDSYTKIDRENPQITGVKRHIDIDYSDYLLLDAIAVNARAPLTELAETLECSSQTVNYRLKNLVKSGVIQGFRAGIDISKLGFENFKVDIWLKQLSKRKQIWNYLKYNPYVTFINTSAGYADLEIEFVIENSDKLIQLMEELLLEFPGAIRKYIHWGSSNEHKLQCIPEMNESDFKK